MFLLPLPDITSWLTDSPDALAQYEAGESPFGLGCFARDSIQRLHFLVDSLANNDEHNRAAKLHYANEEDRRVSADSMKQLLHENKYQEAQSIIKNLTADQVLQAVSWYRLLSKSLCAPQGWVTKALPKQVLAQDELTQLQQQWQVLMPFAFCTSQDLFEKLPWLEELNVYRWLTRHDIRKHHAQLPRVVRERYQQWLSQFTLAMEQVEKGMVCAMLGILRAAALTDNLTCDTMVNTEVMPLLKKLGILKPNTAELSIIGALDATQFAGLMAFIQTHGTYHQKKELAELALFQPQPHDKLSFISVPALGQDFVQVPTLLKGHFISTLQTLLYWLPPILRIDRHHQEKCFDAKTVYQLIALNQQFKKLAHSMSTLEPGSLSAHIRIVQLMIAIEQQLKNEVTRILQAKPYGIKAWFLRGTCQMIATWSAYLKQQRILLLTQEMSLIEKICHILEEKLTVTRKVMLPLLQSPQDLFNSIAAQLSACPEECARELQQRFQHIQARYRNSVREYFLQQVQHPDAFLLAKDGFELDHHCVHAWIQTCSALFAPDEANGMRLIEQIITGEAYPSWAVIKTTLSPLFNSCVNPDHALQLFVNNLLQHRVLSHVKKASDPGYQFVRTLAPSLAEQWLIARQRQLEAAIQIVQYVFNVESGNEIALDSDEPLLWIQGNKIAVNEAKVLQSIHCIWAVSTLEQGHITTLQTVLDYYLTNSAEHKGYCGDNLTYHHLISSLAVNIPDSGIVLRYGGQRFRYLLRHHCYQDIRHDPFLREHTSNAALRLEAQGELERLLANALSDEYIGLEAVIQQWGTKDQVQRYAELRDQYHLQEILQLLLATSATSRIDEFNAHLQQLGETFPQSALGRQRLQALLCEAPNESWQASKQRLADLFADIPSQQAYRLLWLKTILSQQHNIQLGSEHGLPQYPYATWIAMWGEQQVTAVHACIEQFLEHCDPGHSDGLAIVKSILSPEWASHHSVHHLTNKLAAIEHVRQRQMELDQLTQDIQQQLTGGAYTHVADQFQLLLRQQRYCQAKDSMRYPHSLAAYEAALTGLTAWLRQRIFTAPDTLIWAEAIVLPVLLEDKTKTELLYLCQSAEVIRSSYDNLHATLHHMVGDPHLICCCLDTIQRNYIEQGWPQDKREALAQRMDGVLAQLSQDHPLRARLLALQHLLSSPAAITEAEVKLLWPESLPEVQHAALPLSFYIESNACLQASIKQRCLAFLCAIEEGKTWELDALTSLADYYRLVHSLPEAQLFVQAVERTLKQVKNRVLSQLRNPAAWLQLPKSELAQRGQQVIDDCELLRTLGSDEVISPVDKMLNHWLLNYYRLFATPNILAESGYYAVIHEQILLKAGNEFQQVEITALSQLREAQKIAELQQRCRTNLQKREPVLLEKATVEQGISHLFHDMSHTWRQLTAKLSMPKSLPFTSSTNLKSSTIALS